MSFTPDEKIEQRLRHSSSHTAKDISEFLDLIKDLDDESRVFSWFTGWSNQHEKIMMYNDIDHKITLSLEMGGIQ